MRHASIPEALSRLDAFNRLWRKKRVFLAVFLATIGAAVAALVVLPVRYLATASVIVAEPEPGVASTSAAWAQKIGDPADLESQLLVIRSPRLLRQVMNAPGVVPAVVEECQRGQLFGAGSRCDRLASDPTSFIEYIDTRFAVASAGRSRVINISYQSPLPEVAQRLANALTNAFLDDQRNEGASSREIASIAPAPLRQNNSSADPNKIRVFVLVNMELSRIPQTAIGDLKRARVASDQDFNI